MLGRPITTVSRNSQITVLLSVNGEVMAQMMDNSIIQRLSMLIHQDMFMLPMGITTVFKNLPVAARLLLSGAATAPAMVNSLYQWELRWTRSEMPTLPT